MDTIRYLLGTIIKLIVAILIAWFVLWLVALLFPDFKIRSILSGVSWSADWLPTPKNYGVLGKNDPNGISGKEYVPGTEYDGYANEYTHTNPALSNNHVWSGNTTVYVDRYSYIRNISLFEGSVIRPGDKIVAEAREGMFKNGSFAVVIVDTQNRAVAMANTTILDNWSAPGWRRFQVVIPPTIPEDEECLLVFASQQGERIGFPVRCGR